MDIFNKNLLFIPKSLLKHTVQDPHAGQLCRQGQLGSDNNNTCGTAVLQLMKDVSNHARRCEICQSPED